MPVPSAAHSMLAMQCSTPQLSGTLESRELDPAAQDVVLMFDAMFWPLIQRLRPKLPSVKHFICTTGAPPPAGQHPQACACRAWSGSTQPPMAAVRRRRGAHAPERPGGARAVLRHAAAGGCQAPRAAALGGAGGGRSVRPVLHQRHHRKAQGGPQVQRQLKPACSTTELQSRWVACFTVQRPLQSGSVAPKQACTPGTAQPRDGCS